MVVNNEQKKKNHTESQKEYPAVIANGILVTEIIANVGEKYFISLLN